MPIHTSAEVQGTVSAGWSDSGNITASEMAPGTPIRIKASLLIEGSVNATSFGEKAANSHFTSGDVGAALEGLGVLAGPTYQQSAEASDNIAHNLTINSQPETSIQIIFDTQAGVDTLWGEKLTVSLNAQAATVSLLPTPVLGAVGTAVSGLLGNTVRRWGGISSVTDLTTGQLVENWTVTSASGFDYSKAAPEPEPSTFVLLILAAAGICIRLRTGP